MPIINKQNILKFRCMCIFKNNCRFFLHTIFKYKIKSQVEKDFLKTEQQTID